jgi:hypothetical protein
MSIQGQPQRAKRRKWASCAIGKVSAVATAVVAIGLAPVATAQAASAATAAPAARAGLPNPCKTFKARSADAVFRASLRARPTEVLQEIQGAKICRVSHSGKRLAIGVIRTYPGRPGPNFKCHRRRALGSGGKICLPANKKLNDEFVQFKKRGIYVDDAALFRAGNNGARLYRFALTQYRHFKA